MKTVFLLLAACVLLLPQEILADGSATSLGFRRDTEIVEAPQPDAFCPATNLRRNDDNSFENGYLWDFYGVWPPDYGSWAECFDADFVCAVQFFFTQLGTHTDETMDVYVWESDAVGNPAPGPDPGNVIVMIPDVFPGEIAVWPEISAHNVQVCAPAGGEHFVGFWGDWPGNPVDIWFIAADEDGPGGCPRTKVSNQLDPKYWPEPGWHHPNVVAPFEDCKALGIREYAGPGECATSSVPDDDMDGAAARKPSTWGAIKALY